MSEYYFSCLLHPLGTLSVWFICYFSCFVNTMYTCQNRILLTNAFWNYWFYNFTNLVQRYNISNAFIAGIAFLETPFVQNIFLHFLKRFMLKIKIIRARLCKLCITTLSVLPICPARAILLCLGFFVLRYLNGKLSS